MFNQLNAALYEDHSFWAVPGSHARPETEEERTAFGHIPAPGPSLTEAMSAVERELACLEYVRRMPGATPLSLCAGDVAFYRNSLFPIGNYVPYTERAPQQEGFFLPG